MALAGCADILRDGEEDLLRNALVEYCDIPCESPEAPTCWCDRLVERITKARSARRDITSAMLQAGRDEYLKVRDNEAASVETKVKRIFEAMNVAMIRTVNL